MKICCLRAADLFLRTVLTKPNHRGGPGSITRWVGKLMQYLARQ